MSLGAQLKTAYANPHFKAVIATASAPLVAVFATFAAQNPDNVKTWCQVGAIVASIIVALGGFIVSTVMQHRKDLREDLELKEKIAREERELQLRIEAKAHADRITAVDATSPVSMPNILLVEDYPRTARAMSSLLRNNGFTVYIAKNYMQADAMLQEPTQYAGAVIDLRIPGGPADNERAGKLIIDRLAAERPEMSLVVISGVDEDELKPFIDQGITAFHKPWIDPAKLIMALRSVSLQEQISDGLQELHEDGAEEE